MPQTILKRGWDLLRDQGPVGLIYGGIRFLRWRYPFPEVRARHFWNKIRYCDAAPEPFKIITVSPSEIERWSDDFSTFYHVGVIRSGKWDLQAPKLQENVKYRAIRAHFEQGMPWEETEIFTHHKKNIKKRGQSDGLESMDSVRERYHKIDRVFDDIKENGFKTPNEASNSSLAKKDRLDHPAVHIGRNGELIHGDSGWHRFTIARILGIDEIPARVIARHKKWQNIRVKAFKCGIPQQYSNHPDLMNTPQTDY